jgi:hypothetical protein
MPAEQGCASFRALTCVAVQKVGCFSYLSAALRSRCSFRCALLAVFWLLNNLNHRGAVGANPLAGDGAGVLLQLPDALLRAEFGRLGIPLPPLDD